MGRNNARPRTASPPRGGARSKGGGSPFYKSARALAAKVAVGNHGAVSRALSIVINDDPGVLELSRVLFGKSGTVQKVGLCGPPGAGKSTLAGRLVRAWRRDGRRVGVLAVDPSSHVSGGAFLGDRLRFSDHATDSGVFIRSIATRGAVGGVSSTIFGAIHVLEAAGYDRVLVETVGTGQDEVEIARVADTVVYVTTPALGDEIQAMKAGSMEIGDVFVVNKADLGGADKALRDLRSALSMGVPEGSRCWEPRVLAASAAKGDGLAPIVQSLDDHWAHLKSGAEGRERLKVQLREELTQFLSRRIYRSTLSRITERHLVEMLKRKTDPGTLGLKILNDSDPPGCAPPRGGGLRHGGLRHGGLRLDHIGIAVRSIKDSLPFYQEALGLQVVHEETVESQGVKVAFLQAGGADLELLEPTGSETAMAGFLNKRGPGLHHVAFRTQDIAAEMERLSRIGRPPIETAPRAGARGEQVCFLHPARAGGVLLEFVGHAGT